MLRLPLLLVLLLSAAAFVACADEGDDDGDTLGASPTPTAAGATPAAGTPTETATATGAGTPAAGGGGAGGAVEVILTEFAVEPDPAVVSPGEVTFQAVNEGAIPHELVIIQTDEQADSLPVEAGVVQEDQLDVVGEIEEFPAGETESGTFDLEPGPYVLICNIPTHYELGMFAPFSVE